MGQRSLRILVHDYAGHPPQAHVSRELARRGHTVLHTFAGMIQTPRGNLARNPGDAPTFDIKSVTIDGAFKKHAYFTRQVQEMQYGRCLVDVAAAFRPELVVCSNTPLFPMNSLRLYAKRRSVPFVFWMMDVYGVAVKAGIAKTLPVLGPLIGGFYIAFEKFLVCNSDHMILISEGFKDLISEWGIEDDRVDVLPLWAPLEDIPLREKRNPWSEGQNLVDGVNLVYSGTLGLKHNPQHLVTLAERFLDRPEVQVVVISEGPGADFLKAQRAERKLKNMRILPFQTFSDLPSVFGAADVLLVLLEPEAGVFSVPGKVLSHCCAGRPQVGMIPSNNRAAKVIAESGGGLVVDPGDQSAFVEAVARLVDNPNERTAFGRRARAYAECEFDIAKIGKIFERMIMTPLATRQGQAE